MSAFSIESVRAFLNGEVLDVEISAEGRISVRISSFTFAMERAEADNRRYRALHEPLVRLDDGKLIRVRPMCNVPNCPGGQIASETIRSSWAGRFVACDERVHATLRRHGDGFCLCGHVMHRGEECLSCEVLGELCAKATPCPREDAPCPREDADG